MLTRLLLGSSRTHTNASVRLISSPGRASVPTSNIFCTPSRSGMAVGAVSIAAWSPEPGSAPSAAALLVRAPAVALGRATVGTIILSTFESVRFHLIPNQIAGIPKATRRTTTILNVNRRRKKVIQSLHTPTYSQHVVPRLQFKAQAAEHQHLDIGLCTCGSS